MFGCELLNPSDRARAAGSVLLVAGVLVLGGCGGGPEKRPADQPLVIEDTFEPAPVEPVVEEPTAVSHGLQDDEQIVVLDDPWDLVQQANSAPVYEAPGLLIRAINEFIDRGEIQTARGIIDQLEVYPLTPDQRFQLNIIRAREAQASGRPGEALELLSIVNINQLRDVELRRLVLETLAEAQFSLGRASDAAASLLELDRITTGQERFNVQQRVLQLLQSMDPLHISLLRERYRHPDLAGWISLAETLNATTPQYLESDLVNWRLVYPGHPVLRDVLDQSIGTVQLTSYRQIALLLPLTSGYGSAAQAFYDGFVEAQSRDPAYLRPEVILYDIGEEPGLSSLYYQAAINDGADFVVGPLGRKASDSLLANLASETDTLVIADIPEGRDTRNLFSISLSPEDEARQVAHKAYSEGYRQATVFRIEGPWGQRVGAAFVSQWEQLGGVIVKNSSFPKTISDYTRIIQKLLGLDKSIARYRLLEAQTGVDLKFTPRRNEDMDFLFLAANYEQARQVVPQLRFFQAHDLPLYATSYVYSGKPEPAVDADLDGLVFGDMKWMLDGVDLYREKIAEEAARKAAEKAEAEAAALAAQEAEALALAGDSSEDSESDAIQTEGEEATVDSDGESGESTESEQDPAVLEEGMPELDLVFKDEIIMLDPVTGEPMVNDELELVTEITTPRRPYQDTRLDRLYALGLQSYQVIPRLNGLRGSSWNRYIGDAMTVSVDEGGAVIRHPVWSVFKSGLPEPIYRPGSLSLGLQQIQ